MPFTVASLVSSPSDVHLSKIAHFVADLENVLVQTKLIRLQGAKDFGPLERADMSSHITRAKTKLELIAIVQEANNAANTWERQSRSTSREILRLANFMLIMALIEGELVEVIEEFDQKLIEWWATVRNKLP